MVATANCDISPAKKFDIRSASVTEFSFQFCSKPSSKDLWRISALYNNKVATVVRKTPPTAAPRGQQAPQPHNSVVQQTHNSQSSGVDRNSDDVCGRLTNRWTNASLCFRRVARDGAVKT